MNPQAYDVVVIGGGAAGLSAALVLGRARRRVVVVDSGAPRNAPAAHMQGYLSRDGLPPAELLAIGREEVFRYGAEIVEGVATRIDAGFTVHLGSGGVLEARRVLVTTGLRDDTSPTPRRRRRPRLPSWPLVASGLCTARSAGSSSRTTT